MIYESDTKLNKDALFMDKQLQDQLKISFDFLDNIENSIQKQIDDLNSKKRSYDVKLLQINSVLDNKVNVMNTVDMNASFFSPNNRQVNNDYDNVILEEKTNINSILVDINMEIDNLSYRIQNINNLKDCLQMFEVMYNRYNTYIEEINSSYNCESIFQLKSKFGLHILQTQENERKRIARDLHDSTVQNLTNLMHKTELSSKLVDIDPVRTKLELQTMNRTIKSTIDDMRNIIYDLRPMSLDDLGLIDTIERYIKVNLSNSEIDISFRVKNKEYKTLPVINLTLFRIVQEALSNSLKYSKASKILIELEYFENFINLSIEDDGIGFSLKNHLKEETNQLTGFGLSMMKERVFLISGELIIDSNEGKGTKIIVKVPLTTYTGDKE